MSIYSALGHEARRTTRFLRKPELIDSDYDFLVIADRQVHTRRESSRIRRHLRGFKTPIDLIVARSEQVERYKDEPTLIYHVAMNEGKLCYERP